MPVGADVFGAGAQDPLAEQRRGELEARNPAGVRPALADGCLVGRHCPARHQGRGRAERWDHAEGRPYDFHVAGSLPGEVVVQSTTRSPVLAADLPGYAVRRALLFPAPDEPGRTSRLHGLPDEPYADVVVVVDTPADAALPLAASLRPWASEGVHVVSL